METKVTSTEIIASVCGIVGLLLMVGIIIYFIYCADWRLGVFATGFVLFKSANIVIGYIAKQQPKAEEVTETVTHDGENVTSETQVTD